LDASGARKQAKPGFHLAEEGALVGSEAHIARQNELAARATNTARHLRDGDNGCGAQAPVQHAKKFAR
jgi:hypothetical protein